MKAGGEGEEAKLQDFGILLLRICFIHDFKESLCN